MELQKLLSVARSAAAEASKEILRVYNSDNFQVERKGDHSPLTIADKKAHLAITSILESTELPILSEEGKDTPYHERKDWNYFWMVDPLDGTKEFIKRNGEFTVNIALIENQTPVLGVVTVPVTGEEFFGAKGMGAFLHHGESTIQLPTRTRVDLQKPGVRVIASRSHMNEETLQYIDRLNEPQLVSSGSSLKFMLLATGKADVYPRFAPTMEWDTAAAHAIVKEAGFSVKEKDVGAELLYNKPNLLNPYFICL